MIKKPDQCTLKVLWVARDKDSYVAIFTLQPILGDDGVWRCGKTISRIELDDSDFFDVQPGESRMFIEFAPRVADGFEGPHLAWDEEVQEWVNNGHDQAGTIILFMPPDPTPYLTQADTKAARREEIRAQIAELQVELERMGGA